MEFELPGDEAIMTSDGERLIVEPLRGKIGLGAITAKLIESTFGSARRPRLAIDGGITIFTVGRKNPVVSRTPLFGGVPDGILLAQDFYRCDFNAL